MQRLETLPQIYQERIEAALRNLGSSLSDTRRLASAVQKLSDHYIKNPDAQTPWHTEWAALAYTCYYFPLNYLRVSAVLRAGKASGFWQGLTQFTDFGSGLGTVPLAIADALPGQFKNGIAVERSAKTSRIYRDLLRPNAALLPLTWREQLDAPSSDLASTWLTLFSFALTELPTLPKAALDGEALAIIEPATQQDGRRLLKIRSDLLSAGWHVWAPCTHAAPCPLLTESARDWCHDRIAWEAPDWYQDIEQHLPMRNRTLTHSYLLMRRTPPPASSNLARLTGDLQRQKGASKQMMCRGPKREFLSWQHKHGEPPSWPRGALVHVKDGVEMKSNEVRPNADECTLIG
ncbi:MAG: hypothetical protein NTY08_09495 [Proteobacteria bacterium]|nr:hypothetical protein [Pseudomonadota bacterium]